MGREDLTRKRKIDIIVFNFPREKNNNNGIRENGFYFSAFFKVSAENIVSLYCSLIEARFPGESGTKTTFDFEFAPISFKVSMY